MGIAEEMSKKILEKLELLNNSSENISLLQKSLDAISSEQQKVKTDIRDLTVKLLDPDNGVVVRVNKNTDEIKHNAKLIEDIPILKNRMDKSEAWQANVNKVLWFIASTVGALIIGLIFTTLTK